MKDLVQIIRDNPGCVAIVDNDSWTLHKKHPYDDNPYDEETDENDAYYDWQEQNEIACDRNIKSLRHVASPYWNGHCYGGDILQALAVICGVKIESV